MGSSLFSFDLILSSRRANSCTIRRGSKTTTRSCARSDEARCAPSLSRPTCTAGTPAGRFTDPAFTLARSTPRFLRASTSSTRTSASSRCSSPSRRRRSSARSRSSRTSPAAPTSSRSSTSSGTRRCARSFLGSRPSPALSPSLTPVSLPLLAEQNALARVRARQQYRLQGPVPAPDRLRRAVLHLRAPQGARLLPLARHHAPRRQAAQRHDRPRAAQGASRSFVLRWSPAERPARARRSMFFRASH